MKITLGTTEINQQVWQNVNECLTNGTIGQGKFIRQFEEKVEKMFNVKHAIAVCNGTMADIVALSVLKILKPKRKKVIVPALTFIAQTNSVYINGLEPIFVDVTPDGNINMDQVEKVMNEDVLAIFPVHLLGCTASINYLKILAKRYGTYLLEDACEAFGGEVEPGKYLGTYGDIGTYSFFPSHVITTGEGGMIVTNNDEFAKIARKLIVHGRRGEDYMNKFHFDYIGFNAKMSNLVAAVGAGIVEKTFDIIKAKQENVNRYNKILDKVWWAQSPHAYPFWYKTEQKRDEALKRLNEHGVESRKLFSCVPKDEYKIWGEYPIANELSHLGLYLPVHQQLTEKDIEGICHLL